MSESPKLFISFSARDQARVRKLFAALEIQDVSVWDYSDQGQELSVGRDLLASLAEKIDLCEYFVAIITPNSIDLELSKAPYLEVRHAIRAGKLNHRRILPVLLDNPPAEWLSLYPELSRSSELRSEDDVDERVEDAIRRICDWLKVSYAPSALKDSKTFFTKLFLEEIHGQTLGNADFVQLLRIMNSCARKMLADDWEGAKEKTSLFLSLVREMVPEATFQYPLVIKGVCELQLKQYPEAEEAFLKATTNHNLASNPLLGLGYAGLGQPTLRYNALTNHCVLFRTPLTRRARMNIFDLTIKWRSLALEVWPLTKQCLTVLIYRSCPGRTACGSLLLKARCAIKEALSAKPSTRLAGLIGTISTSRRRSDTIRWPCRRLVRSSGR